MSSRLHNVSSRPGFKQIDRAVKAGLYRAMGAEFPNDWQNIAASALSWWESAGVDTFVDDAARDWRLTELTPISVKSARPEARTPVLVEDAPLPVALDPFRAWRVGDQCPESGWNVPLVPPSGPMHAKLMILSDMPEGEDRTRLIEYGAIATLVDNILAAIGLDRAQVHFASLAAGHPVGGRIPPESIGELTRIARHHIHLVQPERLLILGQPALSALFGSAAKRGELRQINQQQSNIGAVASFHPRVLIERPEWKGIFWRDLQRLIGDKG